MNFLIQKYFLIDEIFVCGHDKKDKCKCRKPKNGMLKSAAKKWNIDLKKSFLIGDRWKDIEAGNSVECKTIYIDYNYDEKKPILYNYKFYNIQNMVKKMKKIILK